MTHELVDGGLWMLSKPQINTWRQNTLELPPIDGLGDISRFGIPYIYSYSPNVVPPPKDWAPWIKTVGYFFLDNPDLHWRPEQSLLDFLADKSKPIVYIGFGSIVVPNAAELTKIIVEAVEGAGVRAILAKGWSDRLDHSVKLATNYPDCI